MLATWAYHFRNSLMEKLDPRTRWVFSILFLFTVTMFWDMRFLLFFLAIGWIWFACGRISFRETKRAWFLVCFILFMMVFVNTILTGGGAAGIVKGPGHAVYTLHYKLPLTGWMINFSLTIERLWFGLCQIVRVISFTAIFIIIPYSMDPRLYGVAFRRLGLPDRFAFAMDLAFRYVPTLARDFGITLDAQRARGYEIERVEGGLITQVRRIAPLIIPITIGSILGGEDMINAMDLRCFGLRPRTWIQDLHYHWYDITILAFSIIFFVASIIVRNFVHIGGFWVPPFIIP